jgi:5,5'-dehydrodivanillate O-demethylase
MTKTEDRALMASPAPTDGGLDFVQTGPGTIGGRYMRRFWHPVLRAEELAPGRAKPIRIMSEDFTLYRGETGTPHVVAFRCAHRGTQLSTGWVEGDEIRCFYHGWKYDASGQCIEQPAEPEPFCQRVRVRSYPTEEYLGLIFVYFGEGDPPPLPHYPEFERDDVVRLVENYVARPCNFFNVLEKHVDYSRTEFVHRRSGLGIPRVSAEESEWGITIYGRRPGGELRINQFGMPNVMHNLKPRGSEEEAGWRDDVSWRVPIDDTHHSCFNLKLVHLTGEAADRFRERRAQWHAQAAHNEPELAEAILAGQLRVEDLKSRKDITITAVQDHVYQVGQGAIPDRAADHLGTADVGVVLLRSIWQRELQALAEGRPLKHWVRTEQVMATSTEFPVVTG